MNEVASPLRQDSLHRDPEGDIEGVFADPLISEKALDSVDPASTSKQPAIRFGSDRSHDGRFGREDPRARQRRKPHEDRAVIAQQERREIFITRDRAENISEVTGVGGNDDDPYE